MTISPWSLLTLHCKAKKNLTLGRHDKDLFFNRNNFKLDNALDALEIAFSMDWWVGHGAFHHCYQTHLHCVVSTRITRSFSWTDWVPLLLEVPLSLLLSLLHPPSFTVMVHDEDGGIVLIIRRGFHCLVINDGRNLLGYDFYSASKLNCQHQQLLLSWPQPLMNDAPWSLSPKTQTIPLVSMIAW